MKRALAAAVLLLLAACAMSHIGGVIRPTISGSIIVTGTTGAQRWSPDRCVSGDLAYFAGFDFLSSHDGGHLRAALNPIDGPAVRWTSSAATGQRAVIARHEHCAVLDVDAQPTAWRVNEVREFAGHVELRCTLADGTRLEGRVNVDHCH
jgi:hypothetical protein